MRCAPILSCAILTVAWSSPIDGQERRPRDPRVDTLIADARAVPAEFSADLLIRLAGLSQVRNATKIELLDEAFQRAHSARDDYRLTARPELAFISSRLVRDIAHFGGSLDPFVTPGVARVLEKHASRGGARHGGSPRPEA